MAVAAQGLELVIERLKEELSRREQRSWIRYGTLVRLAGRERQSPALADQLQNAMAEAKPRVFHFPKSLKDCQPEDTVRVSFTEFGDPGLPFDNEGELVTLIVKHHERLAPFSRCTSFDTQRQCDAGVIDLYCRDLDGFHVVFELEKESGRFETASQIRAYIEALHAELTENGREAKVRGVVITGEENPAQEAEIAEWSQKSKFRVDWYYYRLILELVPAHPSEIKDSGRSFYSSSSSSDSS